MRKLKLEEFLDYQFLSAVKWSPDGSRAAFVVKKVDAKRKGYDSCIWLYDAQTGEVRQLTSGNKEGSFLFVGNDALLFAAERKEEDKPEEGKQKTVFYRIALSGGEAVRAFELPYQVSALRQVREGLYAFTAETDLNRPEEMTKEEAAEYQDYHVLTELPYWANGRGFVSGLRQSLFLYEEKDGDVRRVTEPQFEVWSFGVTGQGVFFSGASYDELLAKTAGLYAVDAEGGEVRTLVEDGTYRIDRLACEGGTVYFAATDMEAWGSGQVADIYCCRDCFGGVGAMEKLLDCTYTVGSGLTADCTLGGGTVFMVADGVLYFTAARADGTGSISSELYQMAVGGGQESEPCQMAVGGGQESEPCQMAAGGSGEVDGGQAALQRVFPFPEGCVDCFDVKNGKIVFIGREPMALQELYMAQPGQAAERVTGWNREVLADVYVADCKPAGFVDSDGISIDGWVLFPKGYDPQEDGGAGRYPAILDMHGGPRAAFGRMFFHEMQYWANEGYFVFCCNPRGSDAKGDAFADLRGRWGDIDFKDFMEFTDHVLAEYPAIDPSRVGVTGGSYGGFMTNWIIGHTDRFAAAASQRSFSNWLSDFGCSEIGFSFDVNEVGATPWQDPMRLWENSPVRYADRVKTPTLFIHSLQDYNCPLSEGMQMFAALKFHHVPSRACLFEGENHELSRSGKPKHRIRRLKEITAWMDEYLKKE